MQIVVIQIKVIIVKLYFKLYIKLLLPPLQKKPVDFDGELKIGDVRYDNIT